MIDTTRDQMYNWRLDNPPAIGDQVDCANLPRTSLGMDVSIGTHFSVYVSANFKPTVELSWCRRYKPDNFLTVRSLNFYEEIDRDDGDENFPDTRVPSGCRSCPVEGNQNDAGVDAEDTPGGKNVTGKWMGSKDGKGKWKAT
jgi:hypothetical protein